MYIAKIRLSPEFIGRAGNVRTVCEAFGVKQESHMHTWPDMKLVFTMTSDTKRPLIAVLADHYNQALDGPGTNEEMENYIWNE